MNASLPGRAYIELEPNGVGNIENWRNDRVATIRLDTSLGFPAFEKRAAPRTTISLPVFIVLGGKRHHALLRNLSTSGAMIVTSAPLTLQMKIEFHCGAICEPGIVVWQRRSGSGIKFDNLICERQLKEQASQYPTICHEAAGGGGLLPVLQQHGQGNCQPNHRPSSRDHRATRGRSHASSQRLQCE